MIEHHRPLQTHLNISFCFGLTSDDNAVEFTSQQLKIQTKRTRQTVNALTLQGMRLKEQNYDYFYLSINFNTN